MSKVYADLVIKGVKKFSKVPKGLQEAVKKILVERGFADLAK